jgi:hypothetical protein
MHVSAFTYPEARQRRHTLGDEDEAEDRKAAARVTVDSLRGRSVTELGRMFLQITKGEDLEEASPLATYENRDDAKTSSSLDNRAKDDTTTPNETPPEELI